MLNVEVLSNQRCQILIFVKTILTKLYPPDDLLGKSLICHCHIMSTLTALLKGFLYSGDTLTKTHSRQKKVSGVLLSEVLLYTNRVFGTVKCVLLGVLISGCLE